ncbi:MAG: hypothetical protein ACYTBJ_14975 [Planctomycetota bacterium]|jgi:predicted nucleic acid-binding protein
MSDERTNTLLRDLHDQTAEDASATMIVVAREDLEEMIAVVNDQRSEIDRLNLLIYQQVNRIDRAKRNVKDAIADIEEATRGLMILRQPQVNTLSARAETLLARMGVTDE